MASFTHYWNGSTCDGMFANGNDGDPLWQSIYGMATYSE